MYESFERLKIKERAGVKAAVQEQKSRKKQMQLLPLKGMHKAELYMAITDEMKQRLLSIGNLYRSITSSRKAQEIILLDAYHSATIEGARTTVERVRQAYDNPETKDDKMVINTVKAMNYAYSHVIGHENIRALWEMVVKDVCENQHLAGVQYRGGMVYVGSRETIIHTPAHPDEIEGMLHQLGIFMKESQANIWIKAAVLHFYFVYIHPFCDGNGRVVRILTNAYLYQSGLEKIKYLPLSRTMNQRLSGYYRTLKEAEILYTNGKKWMDITPFLDYFLECVEECMLLSMREDLISIL